MTVPVRLWKEIRDFFAALVAPCKDCVRGNKVRCWNSNCAAFQFRDLARRVDGVSFHSPVRVPQHVLVENEIIDALRNYGKPVYPSQIVLHSTNSKVAKSHAISRLIKRGRIVEERINDYTRKISLPQNGNPKGKNNNEQPTIPTGGASRNPADKLRAGPSDAGTSPRGV